VNLTDIDSVISFLDHKNCIYTQKQVVTRSNAIRPNTYTTGSAVKILFLHSS